MAWQQVLEDRAVNRLTPPFAGALWSFWWDNITTPTIRKTERRQTKTTLSWMGDRRKKERRHEAKDSTASPSRGHGPQG